MPIFIAFKCMNCDWATAGNTDENDYDKANRKAQVHANKEDHRIQITGRVTPDGK